MCELLKLARVFNMYFIFIDCGVELRSGFGRYLSIPFKYVMYVVVCVCATHTCRLKRALSSEIIAFTILDEKLEAT